MSGITFASTLYSDTKLLFFFIWSYFINKLLFSHSFMIDSFRIHVLQRARIPCPSPSPRVCWNSCPLIPWCRPTISYSVLPFSSCLQSFPAWESFLMSPLHIWWPKYWSFSVRISPFSEYSGLTYFRIDWCDLFAVQGTLKSPLQPHCLKASSLWSQPSLWSNSHIHTWLLEKNIALTIQTFVDKVMSLVFNMLSRYSFSSKKQMSFNCMAAVTICRDFGAQENKVYHCFHCFPIYLPWSDGTECHDVHFFECWILSQLFTLLFQLHQEAL